MFIVFNIDEVFVFYFLMFILKVYEMIFFYLSVEKLKMKFECCFLVEKIEMFWKIEEVFSFGYIKYNN